jgi:YjbE family integral membrane protein
VAEAALLKPLRSQFQGKNPGYVWTAGSDAAAIPVRRSPCVALDSKGVLEDNSFGTSSLAPGGLLNFGPFGGQTFGPQFFEGLASIVLIDLLLAGDNAVVIAMAVRSLPKEMRRKGILIGAGAAVLLRVFVTFFVARLLNLSYVKLAGGMLIMWIAIKLFIEDKEAAELHVEAATLWHAVRLIVIADITMSLDNMLAVGGASNGSLVLLIFGLGLSIPFIVLASGLLELLMERYPIIIVVGAALLGKVGGQMMITDPAVAGLFHPSRPVAYLFEATCALGVVVIGKLRVRRLALREANCGRH